jgi:hypothetical protein
MVGLNYQRPSKPGSRYIFDSVVVSTVELIGKLNRRSATESECAFIVPAL